MESEVQFQETSRKEVFKELEEEYDTKIEPKKRRISAYGIDSKTTKKKKQLEKNKKI